MSDSIPPLKYKCFICHSPSHVDESRVSVYGVACSRCGNFDISSRAAKMIGHRDLSEIQRANMSGFIAEDQNILIKAEDLEYLESLRTPNVSEKALKIMRRISRDYPIVGQSFMVNYWALQAVLDKIRGNTENYFPEDLNFDKQCREILPWLATAWSAYADELVFIFQKYLHDSTGLLGSGRINGYSIVTPKGWNFLENLKGPDSVSTNAFVAMWFDSSVHPTWLEAIKPAIEDTGYEPVRIDKVEHNNKIDDEIVANIKNCKFLVADFTGQRGGVYFEAGLAQGLGKQVLWLCRNDDLANVHFDTRQYNFLLWQADTLPQLRTALKNRIEATVGKGSFRRT